MKAVQDEGLDELVEQFAGAVEAQRAAVGRGDAETGNEFAKRYIEIFAELCRRGDAGRNALEVLFDDARSAVRVMAAAYLLRHSGGRAIALLEKESAGKGMTAFGARQALKRWADGTWALDRV
jgi:hypothetical protein